VPQHKWQKRQGASDTLAMPQINWRATTTLAVPLWSRLSRPFRWVAVELPASAP
jgi:hypothetical protein